MSRFEEFKENAKKDIDNYRERLKGNGSFEYNETTIELIKLENKINSSLLIYLFGERLGNHYAERFAQSVRSLLRLMNNMDSDARFFLLYELKTNKDLFAHY
jgi:hypothetical protein